MLVTGPSPGREGELLKNVDMPPFEINVFPELVRELSPWNDLKAFFLRSADDHSGDDVAGIQLFILQVHNGKSFCCCQTAWCQLSGDNREHQ